MSSFVKRLKYYGVGFGIGLLFVFFFFKNRGCSWLPENRVKNAIATRVIVLPEDQKALYEAKKYTADKIMEFLNEGSIVFSESDKKGPQKCYKIELNDESLFFTLSEESFTTALYFKKKTKDMEKHGKAFAIRFPNEKHLIYADSSGNTTCILTNKKWTDMVKLQKIMVKNMSIDFDSSKFDGRAKPVHRLLFVDKKNNEIAIDAIWYKNKINITKFIGMDSIQCN